MFYTDLECIKFLLTSDFRDYPQPEQHDNTKVKFNPNKPDQFCATAHLTDSDPVPAGEIITAAQVVSNVIHRASISDSIKNYPGEKSSQSSVGKKVKEKSQDKKRSTSGGKSPGRGKSPVPMDVDVKNTKENFKLDDVKYVSLIILI